MDAPYPTKASYYKNSLVWIEECCLDEAQDWLKLLKKGLKEERMPEIRRCSNRLLGWLCEGTRIHPTSVRVLKRTPKDAEEPYLGLWEPGGEITLWIDQHKKDNPKHWKAEFIHTLIHEWMHHYEEMMFERTTEHDPIFEERLQGVLNQLGVK